jgi:Mn2+/Fe2+ NRAMP family transporter
VCFVIAIIAILFSYNFYITDNLFGFLGSIVTAIFFIVLMLKNIQRVKKMKEKKDDN